MTLSDPGNLPSIEQLFRSDRRIQHYIKEAGITDTVVLMLLPPEAMRCAIYGLGKSSIKRISALLSEHGLTQQSMYERKMDFLDQEFGDPKDAPIAVLHVTDDFTGPAWRTVYKPLRFVRNLVAAKPDLTVGQLGNMSCDEAFELAYGVEIYGPMFSRIKHELKALQMRMIVVTEDFDMPIIQTKPGRGHLRVVS